jgi:DGQHR domain-containing protein
MKEPYINFSCIKVTQPIGTFYIGAIDARDLYEISYADVRRMQDRDVESYLGIQRELSQTRVTELRQYVRTIDATFPTSIIIAVSADNATFDEQTMLMRIRRDSGVAHIIDGQHRIEGLAEYSKENFQLNVTLFVDMDIEDQAMVFATINLKQTKMRKSLAYDLYEFTKTRSPQKTCHNIAKLLNSKEGSPFRKKIKILGLATGNLEESLTQATFVDRLMLHISRNPMHDRDVLKNGNQLKKADKEESRRLIFRNMFLEDKDAAIVKVLWDYFKAVENRWPEAWPRSYQGNILNRTTGFIALMRFLRDAYLSLVEPDGSVSMEEFLSVFQRIKLGDVDFSSESYKTGSGGEAALYRDLLNGSGLLEQQEEE